MNCALRAIATRLTILPSLRRRKDGESNARQANVMIDTKIMECRNNSTVYKIQKVCMNIWNKASTFFYCKKVQLLQFCVIFKMCLTFQKLMSNYSSSKKHWKHKDLFHLFHFYSLSTVHSYDLYHVYFTTNGTIY